MILQDLRTGERYTVVENGTHARYVRTGHVVYATSEGTLFAVPFDVSNRRVTGAAFPVGTDVRLGLWGGAASFAVSDAGTAAFVHGAQPERALLQWVDRDGLALSQLGSPLTTLGYLALSPDGNSLVTMFGQPSNIDLWLVDANTGDRDRLTLDMSADFTAAWSSDGQRVAFGSYRTVDGTGGFRVYVQDVSDSSEAELIYTAPAFAEYWVFSWSPDGNWVAIVEGTEGQADIYAVSVDQSQDRMPLATTTANEWFPQFSPDGRWLAYQADAGAGPEVFVVSFPDLDRPRQVSSAGGEHPRWSEASNELFYWASNVLMVSQVTTGETFSRTTPQRLFAADMESSALYDVSPNGDRFLLNVKNPGREPVDIHVTMNWLSELINLARSN